MRSWIRQPVVQDGALGLAIVAINITSVLPYRAQQHPLWIALLLLAGQGLPLVARRRFPVPVVAAVGCMRVAYDAAGFSYAPFQLGMMIALYAVFERSGLLWRWVVGVLTAVGLGISMSTPGHPQPYQTLYQGLILVTAAAAGLISRANRAALRAQTRRADQAEAELELGAERERMTIARELHDVVAHHVSLIAIQAEAAAATLQQHPAVAHIDIISRTTRAALTELRRLLGVLRATAQTAPAPSLADLEDLLGQVRDAGLAVSLTVSGTPCSLAAGVDLTAFRVVQEALTNTIRHVGGATAAVTLDYQPESLTVVVTDTPDPHVTPPEPNGAGFGLRGLAERVAACGGELATGPRPEGGFAVTARLPVS